MKHRIGFLAVLLTVAVLGASRAARTHVPASPRPPIPDAVATESARAEILVPSEVAAAAPEEETDPDRISHRLLHLPQQELAELMRSGHLDRWVAAVVSAWSDRPDPHGEMTLAIQIFLDELNRRLTGISY